MHVCQTGRGINFYHSTFGKIALALNGQRYHDGASGSWRWNHSWAIYWHYDLWPWLTLNSPSSKSLKLHAEYFKNDRNNVGVNRSWIGNHPWTINLHHDLWPWMTLNRPRSRSQNFHIKYLEYCKRYNVKHNGGQLGNQQCASYWHCGSVTFDLGWPWTVLVQSHWNYT